MTFDEFFKKKRIDLAALHKAEPALFSEFKAHFEQMGEKSFDHTKKYWFNKTRRQFPLAPEVKTEKPHIANPIAEQTITESLSETVSQPAAKVGFTPRFKAGVSKPAAEEKPVSAPEAEISIGQPESPAAAKPAGFVPRFKMKPKTGEVNPDLTATENTTAQAQPTPPAEPSSKPAGFTPRFKMKPKTEESSPGSPAVENTAEPSMTSPAEAQPTPPAEPASKPAGFTPRFKMKPKTGAVQPVNENPVEPAAIPGPERESNPESPAEETPIKKPVYKPRFVPPKPKEE